MSTARSAWMDDLPDAVAEALNPALEPDEQVEMTLQAVGCTLVLTDRQLIMVRQGANFRPRTGVTSWRRDAVRTHLDVDKQDRLRLVIDSRPKLSAFIPLSQANAARALFGAIRLSGRPEDQ